MVRRLQVKTKTSSAVISALQYADDGTIISLTADGLQRILDIMSENYLREGFIINTTETEILSASSSDATTFSISGNQLNTPKFLLTWCSNLLFSGDLTN